MSLGWEGSDSQWRHYRRAYGIFAAISTPLVLSVHSVVSFDFAMALVPGWHSTLFPPFFVDGAIFSGFAMVLILILPMRYIFNWYPYIHDKHLDAMAKLILVTSLVLTYFYVCEVFTAWYSGDHFERASVFAKATKQYAWAYWGMYFCNCVIPLVFFCAEGPAQHHRPVRGVDLRPHRDVARALQHHRPRPRARLLPVHVGDVLPDDHRQHDHHRVVRLVLHPVPRLHPRDAVALHRRGQGGARASHARRATGPTTRMAPVNVLGIFAHADTTLRAIQGLRAKGFSDLKVYTPVPVEEIEEEMDSVRPLSKVRLFAVVGALLGTATAFFLTIWTSLKWELITGGKAPVSIPAVHHHRLRADHPVPRTLHADRRPHPRAPAADEAVADL